MPIIHIALTKFVYLVFVRSNGSLDECETIGAGFNEFRERILVGMSRQDEGTEGGTYAFTLKTHHVIPPR